jgi:prolyl-tRNA synthetase
LPPKLAPHQVVIVPLFFDDDQEGPVMEKCERLQEKLEGRGLRVKMDDNHTQSPGWRFSEHELRGVPVRLALGPRDLENDNVEVARRDTREKEVVPQDGIVDRVVDLLDDVQQGLYDQAQTRREDNTHVVDDYDQFKEVIDEGGFVWAHWDGTEETEARIQEETSATIRLIPFDRDEREKGEDMVTGEPSEGRVLFAQAY